MASVVANGITIEYERTGSGEPLLLVMGLGAQLTAWPESLVADLAGRGFDVIRHDNRDAGLSSAIEFEVPSVVTSATRRLLRLPVEAPYVLDDMADDAAGLLAAIGVDAAHVVGVSMGGMIAQTLAIRHPDRVRTLTSIMSNPGDGSGTPSPRLAARFARRPSPTRESAVDSAVDALRWISGPHFDEVSARERAERAVARSFRPDGMARQTAAIMASPDRVPALRRLDVPALVIHGLVDPLVRPSGGRATARAIPGSRLLMFPDMGHDLPPPRLGEIADAIEQHARRATPLAV